MIVKTLAADEFEGRAPGTPGGRKAVQYIIDQFAELGLEPGGENGTWVQSVPMIRTQVQAPADLAVPRRRQGEDDRAEEATSK